MSREYLEKQVREYLTTAESLGFQDRVLLLINLIEKITIIDRGNLNFTKQNLSEITSRAKSIFANTPMPIKVSGSELDYSEINQFAMVMATVDFLTLRDALKKQIEVEKK